jgi:NAD(P)-dependent dehydrogenase (short-subunit alcohol dehydrogenase family)
MAEEIDLRTHRALVTGAGQSLGRGIAVSLGAAGAEVVVNDFLPERAEGVAEEIRAAGGRAISSPFDVTDPAMVRAAVDRVNGIDILVNNAGDAGGPDVAGSFDLNLLVDANPAKWDPYRAIFYGVMVCTNACLPAMIERRFGRIVTVISDTARDDDALPNAVHAGANEGAAGFTRSIATENGHYGITANIVSVATMPGKPTQTDTASNAKSALGKYATRRLGEPLDVAALVTYLVSPLASWLTGQTIPVNGGYTTGALTAFS